MNQDGSLRVEIRFKNARLWQAMHDRFGKAAELTRQSQRGAVPLIALVSEISGVPRGAISELLNLRRSPFNRKTGAYTAHPLQLAEALDEQATDLFPTDLYELKLPRVLSRNVEPATVISLSDPCCKLLEAPPDESCVQHEHADRLREILTEHLTPREEKVLKLRWGFDAAPATYRKISQEFGLSLERSRQIEAKAMRKLHTLPVMVKLKTLCP